MKKLLLASTSTIHGGDFLDYLLPYLTTHFKDIEKLLFIPYARPGGISYTSYTAVAQKAFTQIGIKVTGIHEYDSPKTAIENAQGIYVGGGNTFVLLHEIYKQGIYHTLQHKIASGTPYLGTSAGSNIAGETIATTNDMPIMYPESFNALQCIPLNINPHYLDPSPTSTHMGETRATRIKEFHTYHDIPVIGLREGSWLMVQDDTITLQGDQSARVFEQNKAPYEIQSNTKLEFL